MVKTVTKEEFVNILDNIKFKHKDSMEAMLYGCKNVQMCYLKAINSRYGKYNKYFIVFDDRTNNPLVPIILQRDGHIVFFVSQDLDRTNALQFVKDIKQLAKETVSSVGSIFVNTANFYKEAHKLNKLIGFKPIEYYQFYTKYALEEL